MSLDKESMPPFSLAAPSRFDLSTYLGRVKHFYNTTDPSTLLYSKSKIMEAKALMESFKHGTVDPSVTNTQLWKARKLCDSALHPDTGELIFPLFRFSAFAPANIPIAAMLLYPTANPYFIITAQFINQTYNVCVNYANRNASSNMSTSTLLTAYGAAVTSSCGLALGFGKISRMLAARAGGSPSPLMVAAQRAVVPYLAVVGAGIVNLLCIRQTEFSEGVTVYSEGGEDLGKSVVAGRDALKKCSIVRALWCIPICCPPLIMSLVDKVKVIRQNPRLRFIAELVVIGASVGFGVPPALAAYPQRDSLPVTAIESRFHNLIDESGKPIDRVYFNKGL
ncbi:sideroflexin 5 [Salpingoeca rosetta]|uniref:Sideroflexin 5 n=1 Tax=Salpingoeca rosetta (strain ATCC 50818 / BSB-021) TaxID=946362 RepID=F2UI50_SALR5|nr:sideroflexin 5 [Salpingoeca rosetta]EGD76799.1 sideroflexin 5 [Salpingoeca rosetta]|eukprot:XP_004991171.1 sideroflexin 5 [Salpingoeca rosetta]